jgi:hypothetical protein
MKLNSIRLVARGRRGGAIVMVTVLIIALAGLSIALLGQTNASLKESNSNKERLNVRLVAEAGLNAGYLNLRNGGTGNLGTGNAPVAYDGSTYWVAAANAGPQRITLTSTGTGENQTSRVAMTVEQIITPFFKWAAFGKEKLITDSNAHTDSYDSTLGTYAAQAVNGNGATLHAKVKGHVGSNGNITMKQNTKVWGNAVPGPGMVTTIMGNAQLSGTSTPAATPVDMPAIDLPSVSVTGAFTVAGVKTIGPGSVHYSTLLTNTNATLNVIGPMTLICNSFTLGSNSKLLVNATNGPVKLYVVDNFILNSGTQLRSLTSSPKDLQIQLLSDNILDPLIDVNFVPDTLILASNSSLHGTVYAPNAKVAINSNFQIYGSLVARDVLLDSNSFVHFDEDLLLHGPQGVPHYARLSWRMLE